MGRELFNYILKLLEKLSGKKIAFFFKQPKMLGSTAVKSSLGFWYAGDLLDPRDIAYGIFNNGYVEKEETDAVKTILTRLLLGKPSLAFYDIGANTGYYGIFAAFMGQGSIKVYSFEPQKNCCETLAESVRLNGLENSVRIFNFGLSDKAGEAKFYLGGSGSSLHNDFLGSKNSGEISVPLFALDETVKKENLAIPDFIKIDVEGHEYFALKGGEQTIAAARPVIFMEMAKAFTSAGQNFTNANYQNTFK